MPPLRFARVETHIGPMLVAETDRGVAAATRSDTVEAFLAGLRRRFPSADPVPADLDPGWLAEALDGGPLPPVDLRGLPAFDAR
ncbi:MAG: bifunctional DNA-binding transcriptional regulator/O6-methylguanine-DNA methyltransferase Ada, partial [Candidatus Limnocylindria bacterium]